MTPEELYTEWMDGEKPGMRPKRVQALRDDFAEATGMVVPYRVSEIEGWLEVMRQSGVITRKLSEAAGVTTDDDSGDDGGQGDDVSN